MVAGHVPPLHRAGDVAGVVGGAFQGALINVVVNADHEAPFGGLQRRGERKGGEPGEKRAHQFQFAERFLR